MKKTVTIILILILLTASVLLIYTEFGSPIYAPGDNGEMTYDAELYASFVKAGEANDYVLMNELYDKNLSATSVPFPVENYDPTHGGSIYTYNYRVTDEINKTTRSGRLFFIAADVDSDVLTVQSGDYIAIDHRDLADPDVIVLDSYRADSRALIQRLCELLLAHEEKYPTDWDRTLDSMVDEWQMHNAAYTMEYETKRSENVDLNNADEGIDWVRRAAEEFAKL